MEEKEYMLVSTVEGVDYITVEVINKSNNELPKYQTPGSAGMDVRAYLPDNKPVVLAPGERKMIGTGLYFKVPFGWACKVYPRSGNSINYGISLINDVGVLDSDYTGELGVLLVNHGQESFVVNPSDRIAQIIFERYSVATFLPVEDLEKTERGDGGFGHTGIK